MNIAFIEPHLLCVGGIRRIIEIANRMRSRGHAVSIFEPKANPCLWMPNSVPIYKLGKIHKYSFDIVIFNLAEQHIDAQKAVATKKIFWALAPEAMYKSPDIPLRALQHPDFFYMANSSFTAKYVKERAPHIKYEVPVIPGGINTDHFFHGPEISKEYNVLYYGSPRPWKGTSIIETALREMSAGTKFLKMQGLNTPQNKMYTLYNKCDVFVSACQAEGFNFPVLEAMACGTPVVCTDDGGSRDFVKHGHNALVVPRNASNIAASIKEVLNNKKLKRQLVKNGLKTASQTKYKWENVTTKFEEILRRVLRQAKK